MTASLHQKAKPPPPFKSGAALPGGRKMVKKKKKVWAYLDGKKLVEVVQAALDNNMSVADVIAMLVRENPGHQVTFKVV
jgi:hypothetical protein